MSTTGRLTRLDATVRGAVLADCFAEAQDLLREYGEELDRSLHENKLTADDLCDLRDRTLALLDWAAVMMRASRDQLAAGLANARCVGHYHNAAAPRPRLSAQA